MKIKIGRKSLYANLFEIPSSLALEALLPLKGKATRIGGQLWTDLPSGIIPKDEDVVWALKKGDILLFGDDTLLIVLEDMEDHRRYTAIGRVEEADQLGSLQGQEFNIAFEKERKIPELRSISLEDGLGNELSILPERALKGKEGVDRAVSPFLALGTSLLVSWDEAREWLMRDRLLGGPVKEQEFMGAKLLVLDWKKKLGEEEWQGLRERFGDALVPILPRENRMSMDALPWMDRDYLMAFEQAKRKLGIERIFIHGLLPLQEQAAFELLITVNGIGAKTALNIMSCMNITSLCAAIAGGDVKTLKRISGVGPKSAERMIVELRDKVDAIVPEAPFLNRNGEPAKLKEVEDAILALGQLGFQGPKVQKLVNEVALELPENERSSENILRKSIQALNK